MHIIPVIEKIIEHEGLYYALNKEDETIFVTEHQEIANMYYVVPEILQQQADNIQTLSKQLTAVTDEYNAMVMGMIPSGSNLLH